MVVPWPEPATGDENLRLHRSGLGFRASGFRMCTRSPDVKMISGLRAEDTGFRGF